MSTTGPSTGKFVWPEIDEAHARLQDVEKQERRHWLAAVSVMLGLAVALLVLSMPGVAGSISSGHLAFAVRCFVLLAVLFVLWALLEQRRMARTRRQLASELAIIAASETLKLAAVKVRDGEQDRRKLRRISCDERLSVSAQGPDGVQELWGRVIDICEHGIGAIIPGALNPEQEVLLQFAFTGESASRRMKVAAIVRQRTGFRYGFDFVGLSESDREQISSLRFGNDNVVSIASKGAAASQSND